jgi:hypothetical protein
MMGITRRDATAWALSAGTLLCTGCGGGTAEATTTDTPGAPTAPDAPPTAPPTAPTPPPTSPAPEWSMQQVWAFVAGSAASVNLSDTLPAGLKRGGSFAVHPSGAPPAADMALTAAGVLSVSAGTLVGATSGVVFEYREP